jgi:hypothetical protein
MNDPHWDILIHAWLEDSLDESSHVEFSVLMLESAAARRRFWELAEIHGMAREACRVAEAEAQASPDFVFPRAAKSRWFQWRPLAAAAAGVIIGMFSASLLWAVAAPRTAVMHRQELHLANADFEDRVPPSPDGVPVQYSVWSGDFAEITGQQSGVSPKQGSRMFRFLRSDSTVSARPETTSTGNIYQVLDMRSYRTEMADGQARLDWSAWLHWVPGPDEKGMSFAVHLWTFNGDPSILPSNWRDHLYRETAKGGGRAIFNDSPRVWQQMKGSMIIPPDTDFLVIELKAMPPESGAKGEPHHFFGCYADDVRLVLNSTLAPREPK